jgi:integrase
MPRRSFKNVSKFTDIRGKVRWRFRRKGQKAVYLPGGYGSPEFIRAYDAAVNGKPQHDSQRLLKGTIAALVAGYLASSDFKILADNTKRTYRFHLERFRKANCDKGISQITPKSLREKIDTYADRPATANIFRKVMRALCRFGVDRNYMQTDPTVGVRRLRDRTDGIATWTDAEISAFEKRHPVGTKANLALRLLLYTAQRRSDVVRFGRQHERGGSFHIRQQKTGSWLVLPIVPELREALDKTPLGNMTYLVTDFGQPFSQAGFGNWFRARCNEAGLRRVSAHGLRKAAARRMAEAGKSVHEIMAITGHRSLGEVERYTRAASQERLAKTAATGLKGERERG